jgi:hypothetical protein
MPLRVTVELDEALLVEAALQRQKRRMFEATGMVGSPTPAERVVDEVFAGLSQEQRQTLTALAQKRGR